MIRRLSLGTETMPTRAPNLTIKLAIIASVLLALAVLILLVLGSILGWGGCWACGW